MCLLPIARTQHTFVRLAMSSVGAFGTVQSIALLANISSWIEVWGRLWLKDGSNWGNTQEKGLSAAFCLFVLAGIATDWFLRKKLGENPDEVRILYSRRVDVNVRHLGRNGIATLLTTPRPFPTPTIALVNSAPFSPSGRVTLAIAAAWIPLIKTSSFPPIDRKSVV